MIALGAGSSEIGILGANSPSLRSWRPLDLKNVLRHFEASCAMDRVADYVRACPDLSSDERILVVFLRYTVRESKGTVRLYARNICEFLNYCARFFYDVQDPDIRAYISSLRARALKPNTINTHLATIKAFYRTLVDANFVNLNPAAFIKKEMAKHKGRGRTGHLAKSLSFEEIEALLAFTRNHAPIRDHVVLRIMYNTAIRAEETVKLRWQDLQLWQGMWHLIVEGKGSKERQVYIPNEALDELMLYRQAEFGVRPFLDAAGISWLPIFPNSYHRTKPLTTNALYRIVRGWAEKALRKEISPHWMRHTCITHLRMKGATLESLQRMAGHESLTTTMHYNEAAQLSDPPGRLFEG